MLPAPGNPFDTVLNWLLLAACTLPMVVFCVFVVQCIVQTIRDVRGYKGHFPDRQGRGAATLHGKLYTDSPLLLHRTPTELAFCVSAFWSRDEIEDFANLHHANRGVGTWKIRGNVDGPAWPEFFAGSCKSDSCRIHVFLDPVKAPTLPTTAIQSIHPRA